MKSYLIIDFLGCLPLFYINVSLLKIKLIKLVRLPWFFKKLSSLVYSMTSKICSLILKRKELEMYIIYLMRNVVSTLLLVYWLAHIFGTLFEDIAKGAPEKGEMNEIYSFHDQSSNYLESIYQIVITLTTVGYGGFAMENKELMFLFVVLFFGICLFGYVMGNVNQIICHLNYFSRKMVEEKEEIEHWLLYRENSNPIRNLPTSLSDKTKTFLTHLKRMDYSGVLNSNNVINVLRPDIRKNIINIKMNHIFEVFSMFFKEMPFEMRKQIVSNFQPLIIPKETIIIKRGQIPKGIYLILHGKCLISNYKGLVFCKLSKGNYFGDGSLLKEKSLYYFTAHGKKLLKCLFISKVILKKLEEEFYEEILNLKMKGNARSQYYYRIKKNLMERQKYFNDILKKQSFSNDLIENKEFLLSEDSEIESVEGEFRENELDISCGEEGIKKKSILGKKQEKNKNNFKEDGYINNAIALNDNKNSDKFKNIIFVKENIEKDNKKSNKNDIINKICEKNMEIINEENDEENTKKLKIDKIKKNNTNNIINNNSNSNENDEIINNNNNTNSNENDEIINYNNNRNYNERTSNENNEIINNTNSHENIIINTDFNEKLETINITDNINSNITRGEINNKNETNIVTEKNNNDSNNNVNFARKKHRVITVLRQSSNMDSVPLKKSIPLLLNKSNDENDLNTSEIEEYHENEEIINYAEVIEEKDLEKELILSELEPDFVKPEFYSEDEMGKIKRNLEEEVFYLKGKINCFKKNYWSEIICIENGLKEIHKLFDKAKKKIYN